MGSLDVLEASKVGELLEKTVATSRWTPPSLSLVEEDRLDPVQVSLPFYYLGT